MAPRPLPGPTGSADPAALDEVDTELSRLAGLPVADHAEIFAGIHQRLTTSLAATGQEQGQPPRPGQQRGR